MIINVGADPDRRLSPTATPIRADRIGQMSSFTGVRIPVMIRLTKECLLGRAVSKMFVTASNPAESYAREMLVPLLRSPRQVGKSRSPSSSLCSYNSGDQHRNKARSNSSSQVN